MSVQEDEDDGLPSGIAEGSKLTPSQYVIETDDDQQWISANTAESFVDLEDMR